MEIEESHLLAKKRKIAAILFLVSITLLCLGHFILDPRYAGLKDSISQTSVIAQQITSVMQETDAYTETLDKSGKTYDNLASKKDSYISYLGSLTQQNSLNINKMTVNDITDAGNQLYSMKVEIELQGSLYNVKNFVQQLYDSETFSRINAFSYRLQSESEKKDQLQWMWRSIDDQQLIPWWTLTSDNQDSTATENQEESLLSADDLMAHGTSLCYLEVEFLGTGG